MRSVIALAAFAALGNWNVVQASRCKPHPNLTMTTTTASPSTTETEAPLAVKNVLSNGNFATRDPDVPVPGFIVEGQAQIVTNKGYTGDGSKEQGCVEMSARSDPTKRKRGIGNVVSISQQLLDLDTKKKYTVRFFYAVVTASSGVNVCTLSASIGGLQFFTSTILSLGQAIEWNTVLAQTDVPNTDGAFAVSIYCPVGGVAAIYLDSIFMSNQVTPDTIDTVKLDFGDGSDTPLPTTTSKLVVETKSNALDTTETSHEASTVSMRLSSTEDAATTVPTTSDIDASKPSTDSRSFDETLTRASSDISNSGPSSMSWSGDETVTRDATSTEISDHSGVTTLSAASSAPTLESSTESDVKAGVPTTEPTTNSVDTPSTATYNPVSTENRSFSADPSTKSQSNTEVPTLEPTTATMGAPTTATHDPASSETSSPSGSRVCPAGSPPPGYCTPVQPQVTLTQSLPGIPIFSENDQPTAPRACWATGVPKSGTWGRTKDSNPRQNSIEDCAFLCKKEGSACKAFALNTLGQETSCWMLGDRLGVVGIDLGRQRSLVWNDFDCFECHDCDIKNPLDIETSTSQLEQSSTAMDVTTSAAPLTTVLSDTTTSQAPTSDETTSEQTTEPPTRTEPLTTFSSSYLPTTTESIMAQCTLALSDGCVMDPNADYSDCNKSGKFKNTFTLRDEEYPWQIDTQNCAALCYHMPSRCKASAYDNDQRECIFASRSIYDSSFTPSNEEGSLYWSEQSCNKCFCHNYDRDDYYASLATALPQATCAPSIASAEAVCEIKSSLSSDVVCQHSGYFPWAYDTAPSKFPYQDSEERCAALCNSNPNCAASAWSAESGCAIGYHQLKSIQWSQFGNNKMSWSDKGCWNCSDCIKSQKWRIINF
ncbi:hypothetical protein NW752_004174 [Fusarium irregulare]|uniref:Apple domain-containing protein n=1 Tax=Fusarium irregulare TaxID=2494466 RepID=A0A9W8PME7_9HYPO|nr:hypothetical protein NW766_007073 [Fusarium irregulare]KAJ4021167.1 hypothetical protein NW752_004174 [Fusarium irregulare]